jgi:hypothetical protein
MADTTPEKIHCSCALLKVSAESAPLRSSILTIAK